MRDEADKQFLIQNYLFLVSFSYFISGDMMKKKEKQGSNGKNFMQKRYN